LIYMVAGDGIEPPTRGFSTRKTYEMLRRDAPLRPVVDSMNVGKVTSRPATVVVTEATR